MLTGPLQKLKPSFSGHETFPMRYGWLTKIMDFFNPDQDRNTLIDKYAIFGRSADKINIADLVANFGVGKNMVYSMKFWGEKSGTIKRTKEGGGLTDLGQIIFNNDPYLDYQSTLWLIHWKLCSNPKQLTAFYYAFNYYTSLEVSRHELANSLLQLKKDNEWVNSADESIKRDCEVLFRSYTISRNKKNALAEDSFECPLSELNIIHETINANDAKTYQFVIDDKKSIDNYVFGYALEEFWNTNYKDQETLTIDKITNDFGSPGKVFKIDELSIANRLSELENLTKGYYRWTDTTGLNQMSRNKEVSFNSIKFLEKSFKQIKKQKVA